MKHNQQRLAPGPRPPAPPACSSRRGVLLLVVLSLLVLFALIGVTFVLVAGQYYRSTKMALKNEQTGDDPRRLCDAVLAQIVRDTTDTHSVLRGHSLLNDLYGNDGIKLVASAGGSVGIAMGGGTTEQLLDLTFTPSVSPSPEVRFAVPPTGVVNTVPATPMAPYPLSLVQIQTPGYFNGCVLTMLDGTAAGRSTRIVGWDYNSITPNAYTIRVMAFDGFSLTTLTGTTSVLINGRPFNGTGFGFNPAADPTDPATLTLLNGGEDVTVIGSVSGMTATGSFPYALLPNPVFADPSLINRFPPLPGPPSVVARTTYTQFGGIGGADEDYDASDAQNMLLAHMPLNPTVSSQIIPSLHRPDTIAHVTASPDYVGIMAVLDPTVDANQKAMIDRQLSLRPSTIDHTGFQINNPSYTAAAGPWDLDNDGDGIADSIWVDVGLPVQTAPDGRTFKPLVAILCLDLDGRLNVNAHGNVAQANANYSTAIPLGTSPNLTIADYLYSNSAPVALPRGSGYGPAEINLQSIFQTPATQYAEFFTGITVGPHVFEGRYGEFGTTAVNPTVYPFPMPGVTDHNPAPRADDLLGKAKRYGVPSNYFTNPAGYGSPSDVWGRAVMGIDYAGQPIYSFLKQSPTVFGSVSSTVNQPDPDRYDDPYILNLSLHRIRSAEETPTSTDNPFTAGELERILRKYDVDATSLPDRLRVLLDPTFNNANDLARLITTDSFDLPSPGGSMTRDAAVRLKGQNGGTLPASVNFLDLLRSKIASAGILAGTYTPTLTPADHQAINSVIDKLVAQQTLPPEVLAGVRFDLNRPFGNGEDDSMPANNVVDEPTSAEFSGQNEVPSLWPLVFPGATINGMDLNRDDLVNANDLLARQQYAKQLYVLMMTLLPDTEYAWAVDGSGTALPTPLQKEVMARRVAQWAVNVVDFRDPDSIMTPFEYDVDPFNDPDGDGYSWDVDGIVNGLHGISSTDDTAAERRLVWGCEKPELLLTETLALHDRRTEDKPPGNLMGDSTPDDDYDQVRVPQGSLFLEFYCPRTRNGSEPFSGDLYNGTGQLDLGRLAPAGAGGQYPVWRVAISRSTFGATGPQNNLNERLTQAPDATNLDPPTTLGNGDSQFYSVFDPAHPSGAMTIDRIIWFTNQSPTGNPDVGRIYYNAGAVPTALNPGQYAVVGPRPTTYVGLTTGNTLPAQQISLNSAGPTVAYSPANPVAPNQNPTSYPALPIICTSASNPAGWTTSVGVGVSVSEPLFSGPYYYQMPTLMGPDGTDTYGTPIDIPADGSNADPNANAPLSIDGLFQSGIKLNYKTALLQRLANPLEAYDPVVNPYITVDWQPIDLLVFNGQPRQTADNDPDDVAALPPAYPLGGRERGSLLANASLWNNFPQFPTLSDSNKGTTPAVFDYNINQSLGYVNKSMGTPWSPPPDLVAYTGIPDPATASPFHWLTWNNRPFVSAMELLQVPATAADQLLREFSSTPTASTNPYPGGTPGTFHLPCKHLLNFMISADGSDTTAPYFYRLLEYVQVPSPFVGTETVLNPDTTLAAPGFHAPFNTVSNYRDPGRVNINTIPTDAVTNNSPVWIAILNGGPGPTWTEIIAARRGDAMTSVTAANTVLPSYFSHPFRSAGGAMFNLPGSPMIGSEVGATLLRPQPAVSGTEALFQNQTGGLSYTDPNRNSYFRYQPLSRTSNLLTTRSSVYAIWVTVGYFDASLQAPDEAHPDGFRLGQELGSDTGEIRRHRAFYIYDRSIPVGFEPGKDHNFEDGLLLKRFIE